MGKSRAPHTAVIVLNRNLPRETDRLCEQLIAGSEDHADLFVVESGSHAEGRSRYATWVADWPDAVQHGLRYPRGFNFGLSSLYREGRLGNYDYVFLVCNDIDFKGPVIPLLVQEMENHPKLGILSPSDEEWGELAHMRDARTAYVWHIPHVAWMMRRSFIEAIMQVDEPMHMSFLYDGSNFRGYLCDIELIVKGYANDWATGLTNRVLFRERVDYLTTKADLIRTDPLDVNLNAVVEEGARWLKRKYGFTSRWQMKQYAQLFFDEFFRLNPDLGQFRLLQSRPID